MNRRNQEAAERRDERRRREDEAPRLAQIVPSLEKLRLEVEEKRAGGVGASGTAHVRHIVVLHAPALFVLPCQDAHCKDGGHDVTDAILRSLRAHEERFEGENACIGSVGNAECQRVVHYVGLAEYSG